MPFDFLDETNIPGIGQINSALTSGVQGLVGTGSKFPTQMVANTRTTQYSVIFLPGGNAKKAVTFTFPITPQQYAMQRRSLASVYETPGGSKNQNVNRIIDVYGLTPMTFRIQGTTGFNKYVTDGFKVSGVDQLKQFQTLVENFFNNGQNSIPDQMQFLDFYYQEFWNVVPVGPVVLSQTKEKPQWIFYDFTLAGVSRVASPPGTTTKNGVTNPAATNNFMSLGNVVQTAVAGAVLLAPHI